MTSPIDRHATRATTFERAYWPAVGLAFVGGLALRMVTFTLPWVGAHNAWGGAFYSNVARNFLRYGYGETGLAPVVNTGVVDPSQFEIYYHHPVLSMWLTSVSFQVFGVHEWSARLAPLVFAMLTMALVFSFARSAFGDGAALLALAFYAVLPVDVYYATHLDPYGSMAIFFTVLALVGYRRWLDSSSGNDLAICAVSIVLGCWTSWFTYFVIPGIVAHAWFTHSREWRRERLLRLALLPALAVCVFGLFMLHRKLTLPAERPEVLGSLVDRLLLRTFNLPIDRAEIIENYLRHIWTLYTIPFIVLIASWLVLFVKDARNKLLTTADWCVAILLSFGFLYGLAFPGHLIAHDYFVRAYAPGVALACAVVVWRATRAMAQPSARLVAAGAVVAVTAGFAIVRVRELYAADGRYGETARTYAEAVTALTTPRDSVYLPNPDDRILAYYLDRPARFAVDSVAKIEAIAVAAKGPYLIVVQERDAPRFPELLAHLRSHYQEVRDKGLFLYRGG